MLGTLRRIIAGSVLIFVGLLLLNGDSVSAEPAGSALGLVAIGCCGVVGAAVIAGASWGRILGLCISVAVFLVGASLASAGVDSPFAAVLFSPADAARWYVVMPSGFVYAALSAIAGFLLLLPFAETPAMVLPAPPEAQESQQAH